MRDLIDRHEAVKAIMSKPSWHNSEGSWYHSDDIRKALEDLPTVEIVRCKDCKYRDENWRRVSVEWLPCMEIRTGGNWFCASAERREDDKR